MLKQKKNHNLLILSNNLKKRKTNSNLYYLTGRPIFNQIYDKHHVFVGKNNTMTGSYF